MQINTVEIHSMNTVKMQINSVEIQMNTVKIQMNTFEIQMNTDKNLYAEKLTWAEMYS